MYLCVELEEDKDLDLELQWLAGWVPFQAADPGIWEPAAPTLFFGRWPFHPCTIIFNSYSNSLKFSRSPNGCKEALKLIQAMSIASHRSCHCRLLGFRLLVSVLALVLVLATKPDSWLHFDSHTYSIVPCSSLYSLLFFCTAAKMHHHIDPIASASIPSYAILSRTFIWLAIPISSVSPSNHWFSDQSGG